MNQRMLMVKYSEEQSMKWEQIIKNYSGKWVLLENVQVDEYMNIIQGNVLFFHPDKNQVMENLLELKPKKFAIEYIGKPPEDITLVRHGKRYLSK